MACNSCGKNRHSAPVQQMAVDMTMAAPEMEDGNFIMVRLVDGNRGDHAIVGHVTKNRYGHRSHGDTFLMAREDVAVKPGAFQEIVQASVAVPQSAHQPTPEPVAVDGAESLAEKVMEFTDNAPSQMLSDVLFPSVETKRSFDLQLIPGVTASIAEQLAAQSVDSLESLAQWGIADLMALKGVGEARAEQIRAYVDEQLK